MQSVNEIVKAIHSLPQGEQDKIREILVEGELQERVKNEKVQKEVEQYKKARKWIDENNEEYMNQWVCLDGDKLIAHGTDGREVHRKAKEAGIKIPFIKRIINDPEAFIGGWS